MRREESMRRGHFGEQEDNWLHLSSSESLVWILWAGLMISALSFAFGFRTRTSGVIALLLHTSLHAQNYTATLGWAVMIKPFMAYVIMSRAGEFASLDAYIRRRRGSSGSFLRRIKDRPASGLFGKIPGRSRIAARAKDRSETGSDWLNVCYSSGGEAGRTSRPSSEPIFHPFHPCQSKEAR